MSELPNSPDGDPGGMKGPYPASEIPKLVSYGLPEANDRQRSWLVARRWGGYAELEWTFGVFVQRVRALSGRVPALFYESLSDFDVTRRMLRTGSHLLSRNKPTAPLVAIGFEYFDHAYRVTDGRLTMPAPTEAYRGRHSVAAFDHDDLDSIRFMNSWGERWGDGGSGYVSREYFEAHVDEVWISWRATAGPSPKMAACLRSYKTRRLPADEQYLHCWPTPNDYWREVVHLNGIRHELLNWNVMSAETGRLVDVLELRSPGRIVARCHLNFGVNKGVVTELFVPPGLRRRGYGSILEEIAVDRCRSYGLRRIELWLSEADARARLRPTAEAFATQRGYVWTDEVRRRPNVRAEASKEIV